LPPDYGPLTRHAEPASGVLHGEVRFLPKADFSAANMTIVSIRQYVALMS